MNSIITQAAVIGAGVIGNAVAAKLSSAGIDCIVLEKTPRIAEGVTSRNSGVVHAGLYYPPESLKSASCIRGNKLLYEWCQTANVSHRKLGKWVVGSKQDLDELESLYRNAMTSGAQNLGTIKEIAIPGVSANFGFFSPETGIVDPYELAKSLCVYAQDRNATYITSATVLGVSQLSNGNWLISSSRGEVEAECIINCAGLFSDEIARLAGITKYTIYPWRGDYFRLKSKHVFESLIYPVKNKYEPGLGIHLTISFDGSCRLGPDVKLWHSKDDFSIRDLEQMKTKFLVAARRYLTNLNVEDLEYDTCGIRPKLRSPTDKGEKDFVLSMDKPGWINLIGIESPGLTAALDLADRVHNIMTR